MITKREVFDVVDKICDAFPHRMNPSYDDAGDIMCIYTDPENPQLHCIVGQVLVENGHEEYLPLLGSDENHSATPKNLLEDSDEYTIDAIAFLEKLQREFDNLTVQGHTWRVIWDLIREDIWEKLEEQH